MNSEKRQALDKKYEELERVIGEIHKMHENEDESDMHFISYIRVRDDKSTLFAKRSCNGHVSAQYIDSLIKYALTGS